MSFDTNTLYYGDCLDWMSQWDDQSVDLIYLDPPFNSKTQYNVLFGSQKAEIDAQYKAFEDTWTWDEAAKTRFEKIINAIAHPAHIAIVGLHTVLGECGMLGYLTYMAERLVHMHRLLKPDGSIYLHCDPTASHYLKALMDTIWGPTNFRNEIVWRIGWVSGFKTQKRGWIRNHDTILYYLKSNAAARNFNKEYMPYTDGYVRRDGKPPTGKGIPIEDTWNCSEADKLDSIMIKSFSTEKLGYPTQKPLALLDRIIKASSNEGDVVLDPFCGCGTSIDSAYKLNRKFIGVDISAFAIDLIRSKRMSISIPAKGIPTDMYSARMLAQDNPFNFESWAITRIPGFAPNTKQVRDGGVDGRGKLAVKPDNMDSDLALAQAKGGKFSLSSLRDFLHVNHRDSSAFGCYITLDNVTSRDAMKEVTNYGIFNIGITKYNRMNLWSVEDYFNQNHLHTPPMKDPYNGKIIEDTQWQYTMDMI